MHREDQRREGMQPSIVIVDDHPLYRSATRRMLEDQPDLELVGEAADGLHDLELFRRLRPALVLMDVMMRDGWPGGH